MKSRISFKGLSVLVIVALVVMAFTLAHPPQANAKKIKLTAVSFLPVQAAILRFMGVYAERVTERAKGELEIKWLGGPEVIPTPALAEAVMKGRVDLAYDVGMLFTDNVPGAFGLAFSEYTAMEEREKGIYEWIDGQFRKAGLHYLFRAKTDMPFYMFTNFPIKGMKDFEGRQIGALDFTMGFTRALGASPVNVPKVDWYISVERGLVDGYFLPAGNMVDYKLHEVTKYVIDHDIHLNQEVIVINLKKWNKLPEHLRKLMTDVAIEMGPEVRDHFIKDTERARNSMQDAGLKFVKFSAADEKAYRDTFWKAVWEDYAKVASPEVITETKKMMLK